MLGIVSADNRPNIIPVLITPFSVFYSIDDPSVNVL